MNYKKLIQEKTYEEMTAEEQLFCYDYEIKKYLPRIKALRKRGIKDYIISAYLIDLYQNYMVCDDVCIADRAGISDENYNSGIDYYWNEMTEDNLLINLPEAKYRIDFYYWKSNLGFVKLETIINIDKFINANEYVKNIGIDFFDDISYDAIWVKIVDNENDYVLSEYWWELND